MADREDKVTTDLENFKFDEGGTDGKLVDPGQSSLPSYGGFTGLSFPRLIEYITSPSQAASVDANDKDELFHDFLLQYRSFVTPEEFIKAFFVRFNKATSSPVRVQVLRLLRAWLGFGWFDFQLHIAELSGLLTAFLKSIKDNDMPQAERTEITVLTSCYQRRLAHEDVAPEAGDFQPVLQVLPMGKCPASIIPKKTPTGTLLDWDPLEIARQLTILDWDLFTRIQPPELWRQGWIAKGEEKNRRSPHVVQLMEQFNRFSAIFATIILRQETKTLRCEMLTHLIKVGNHCLEVGNLSGGMCILSGTSLPAIHRLKDAWQGLSSKTKKLHDTLRASFNNQGAFKALRGVQEQRVRDHLFCNPYIGMTLTDLVFIEDGNPGMVNLALINLHRVRRAAQQIRGLLNAKHVQCPFAPVPDLQSLIVRNEPLTEDEQYQVSCFWTPRPNAAPTPRPAVLGPPPAK